MKQLDGIRVVNLSTNLPGPAAGQRFQELGAQVVKVEPLTGDLMKRVNPKWYEELTKEQEVLHLDIKTSEGMECLKRELEKADLFITATRPAALKRLGLSWEILHKEFPELCQVAIVGYPHPYENKPGHDLTYQAKIGLLIPPHMPRALIADMAGAEMAVSEGLALLLAKKLGNIGGYIQVALSDAANFLAQPWTAGLTSPGSILGGGRPEYNLYEADEGWIAVAALEPHFKKNMDRALGIAAEKPEELRSLFKTRTANEWELWAKELDLPIVAVCMQ